MYSSLSLYKPQLNMNKLISILPLIAGADVVEDDETVDEHELVLLYLAGVLSFSFELVDHALSCLSIRSCKITSSTLSALKMWKSALSMSSS